MVAALAAASAATVTYYSHGAQRDKEIELLWIGSEFRLALLLYYESTPGSVKQYPNSLDDLLLDKRFPAARRYLRRIYSDPMTGKADWMAIEAPGGGILGVRSRSDNRPIKTGNFEIADTHLEGATKYSEWLFYYVPSPYMAPARGRLNPAVVR